MRWCTFDPKQAATDRGLTQQSSAESLEPIVAQVLADNATVVADVKGGNEKAVKFLVGQGMKLSKGTANPQMLEQMLLETIT